MTGPTMTDWYRNFFLPYTKKLCRKKNIAFKILLVLDNAPGHPDLTEINPNVKVTFLPANTTSLLQPMDMGVISIAKTNYKYELLDSAIKAAATPQRITLLEFLKKITILDAMRFFGRSWESVPTSAMQGVWNKLRIQEPESTESTPESIQEIKINEIIQMGEKVGITNLDTEVVIDSVNFEEDDLTIEELLELDTLDDEPNLDTVGTVEVIEVEKKLKSKDIKKALQLIQEGCDILSENDPDHEQFIVFKQAMTAGCSIYKDLLKVKQNKNRRQKDVREFFPN